MVAPPRAYPLAGVVRFHLKPLVGSERCKQPHFTEFPLITAAIGQTLITDSVLLLFLTADQLMETEVLHQAEFLGIRLQQGPDRPISVDCNGACPPAQVMPRRRIVALRRPTPHLPEIAWWGRGKQYSSYPT